MIRDYWFEKFHFTNDDYYMREVLDQSNIIMYTFSSEKNLKFVFQFVDLINIHEQTSSVHVSVFETIMKRDYRKAKITLT
jgi:hypothetical protein